MGEVFLVILHVNCVVRRGEVLATGGSSTSATAVQRRIGGVNNLSTSIFERSQLIHGCISSFSGRYWGSSERSIVVIIIVFHFTLFGCFLRFRTRSRCLLVFEISEVIIRFLSSVFFGPFLIALSRCLIFLFLLGNSLCLLEVNSLLVINITIVPNTLCRRVSKESSVCNVC